MATPASSAECATRLQLALHRGELTMEFQPKFHIRTGVFSGVEALARWEDPESGPIPPSVFVAVAERSGLTDALTEWGLKAVVAQWARWRDQGLNVPVAFNISALSLRDVYLPDYIQKLCMQEGMPCEYLTVEVTESATQNVVRLLDTLTRFRLKGIGVSLDDFGTGYSSLLQLRQLPYSEIKIDRCFVADAARSKEARLIVRAIVDLAHGMGLVATAEGVEDVATLDLLREIGCDDAQGFLISKAMEGSKLADWLMNLAPLMTRLGHEPETAPAEAPVGAIMV